MHFLLVTVIIARRYDPGRSPLYNLSVCYGTIIIALIFSIVEITPSYQGTWIQYIGVMLSVVGMVTSNKL